MPATLIVECQQFANEIVAASGAVPTQLQRLLTVAGQLMAPATAHDPLKAILDQAADGELDPEQLDAMIAEAAAQQNVADYRGQLGTRAERGIVARWHRALRDGAADAVLNSLRKTFDKHAAAVATARTLIPRETELTQWLSTAEPAAITAWQSLDGHLAALTAIGNIAAAFGCRPTARFPLITEVPGDNYKTNDVALFCACGGLVVDSMPFLQITRENRQSAWLAVPLRLNTVSEARERYRAWCEGEWDKIHTTTTVQYTNPADGSVAEIELENPYRQKVQTA